MINLIIITLTVIKQNKIIPIELAHIDEASDKLIQDRIEIKKEELDAINKAMVDGELFLDPNLTINDLAEEMGIPAYIISKQINGGLVKLFSGT